MTPLNFRELQVFWAIMHSGSIGGAARALNVTQPAVSMMLKSAEQRFGVKLFDRNSGRALATAEARLLLPSVETMMAGMEEFGHLIERLREGQMGTVSIASTPSLAVAIIYPVMPDFHNEYPGVKIAIHSVSSMNVAEFVSKTAVDFGLAYAPAGNVDTDAMDIAQTEVFCVLRADNPLSHLPVITPADLADSKLITYRPETPLGAAIQSTFQKAGIVPNVVVQTSSLHGAYLCQMGVGVSLLDPRVLAGNPLSDLVVRPFQPQTSVRIQVLTHRKQRLSSIATALRTRIAYTSGSQSKLI